LASAVNEGEGEGEGEDEDEDEGEDEDEEKDEWVNGIHDGPNVVIGIGNLGGSFLVRVEAFV